MADKCGVCSKEFKKNDVAYELTDSWWVGEDDLNTTHTIDLYCTNCGGDILLFIKKLTKAKTPEED